MLRAFLVYINLVERINRLVGKVIAAFIVLITFITVFEVMARYIFKRPTIWAWDLNIQLFAALVMIGGGYTLMEKGHVAIDIIWATLSPRTRAVLDVITSFFFFLGIGVILLYGWEVAWASWKSREAMPTIWGPPYYTYKACIPAGAVLLLLQGLAKLLQDLIFLIYDGKVQVAGFNDRKVMASD